LFSALLKAANLEKKPLSRGCLSSDARTLQRKWLAKIRCFKLLQTLFLRLYISTEVYPEVVISGTGLPGTSGSEAASRSTGAK
jgi:hypothetical protein